MKSGWKTEKNIGWVEIKMSFEGDLFQLTIAKPNEKELYRNIKSQIYFMLPNKKMTEWPDS